MSATPPPAGLTESDFERIEAAVMETERGRWFLAEYARRIRAETTDGVMAALGRIEDSLRRDDRGFGGLEGFGAEAGRRLAAQAETLVERLQDLAWRLREQGALSACRAIEGEMLALRALMAPAPIALGLGGRSMRQEDSALAEAAFERPADLDMRESRGALSNRLRFIGQDIGQLGIGQLKTGQSEEGQIEIGRTEIGELEAGQAVESAEEETSQVEPDGPAAPESSPLPFEGRSEVFPRGAAAAVGTGWVAPALAHADPRLAAFAELDRLSVREKLAVFF